MKLSNLYTEGSSKNFRKLLNYANKAASKIKKAPNPRELRIREIIKKIYQKVWGDFYQDPLAQMRIKNYCNSILQHMPKFLKMNDKELKYEVEMLFRACANKVDRSF